MRRDRSLRNSLLEGYYCPNIGTKTLFGHYELDQRAVSGPTTLFSKGYSWKHPRPGYSISVPLMCLFVLKSIEARDWSKEKPRCFRRRGFSREGQAGTPPPGPIRNQSATWRRRTTCSLRRRRYCCPSSRNGLPAVGRDGHDLEIPQLEPDLAHPEPVVGADAGEAVVHVKYLGSFTSSRVEIEPTPTYHTRIGWFFTRAAMICGK